MKKWLLVLLIVLIMVFISGTIAGLLFIRNVFNDIPKNIISIQGKNVSIKCQQNKDCAIEDTQYLPSCCNRCGENIIDYTLDRFKAVNINSYGKLKPNCGKNTPCPACIGQLKIINTNYTTNCSNGICMKIPK